MLSGDNGILQKATIAKENTDNAHIKEKIRLAYNSALTKDITDQKGEVYKSTFEDELEVEFPNKTISITESTDKKEWIVTIDGITENVPIGKDTPVELPKDSGTIPYFPSANFKQLEGTNLNTGLVITDKSENEEYGNEYVWIEVPNKNLDNSAKFGPNYAGKSVSGSTDYDNIEAALIEYVNTDLTYVDETKSTITAGSYKDQWYDGCGINNSDEYVALYHKMLKSIYENGGFWIGRYEAGQSATRTSTEDSIDGLTPQSKINLNPIIWVSCNQAQTIANSVPNKGTYSSSIMFGIQWDMVLKFIYEKEKGTNTNIIPELTSNSSGWGNFQDSIFTLHRGKYVMYSDSNNFLNTNWKVFTENETGYVENSEKKALDGMNGVLCTTGACNNHCKLNIYDLAGNVGEWTLESTSNNRLSVFRAEGCIGSSSYYPATVRSVIHMTFEQAFLRI